MNLRMGLGEWNSFLSRSTIFFKLSIVVGLKRIILFNIGIFDLWNESILQFQGTVVQFQWKLILLRIIVFEIKTFQAFPTTRRLNSVFWTKILPSGITNFFNRFFIALYTFSWSILLTTRNAQEIGKISLQNIRAFWRYLSSCNIHN